MCFAELNGNKLTFSLPPTWKATVDITFTGSNKKKVDICWDTSGGAPIDVVDFCTVGPSALEQHLNTQPGAIETELLVFYDTEACNGIPAVTPATNSHQVDCKDRGTIKSGEWLFECPDSSDTVGITIMIEEETVDP